MKPIQFILATTIVIVIICRANAQVLYPEVVIQYQNISYNNCTNVFEVEMEYMSSNSCSTLLVAAFHKNQINNNDFSTPLQSWTFEENIVTINLNESGNGLYYRINAVASDGSLCSKNTTFFRFLYKAFFQWSIPLYNDVRLRLPKSDCPINNLFFAWPDPRGGSCFCPTMEHSTNSWSNCVEGCNSTYIVENSDDTITIRNLTLSKSKSFFAHFICDQSSCSGRCILHSLLQSHEISTKSRALEDVQQCEIEDKSMTSTKWKYAGIALIILTIIFAISSVALAETAIKVMEAVITGEDFKIPSHSARLAVETATQLLGWIAGSDANMEVFSTFISSITAKFEQCFVVRKSMKRREELMWQKYHALRVSDSFRNDWDLFLKNAIGQAASPTFYQYVSHQIFKDLIKQNHHIPESSGQRQPSPLTKHEENALRYVSGYVCRSVQKKIKSSTHPNKDEMILFISELSGDEWDEDRGTEEWTNAIDRGGLWHISDNTYTLFYLMEEEIRQHLQVKAIRSLNEGTKKMILDATLGNDDLQFHWSVMSAMLDDCVGVTLLQKLVELYLTIRGFAF